MKYQCKLCGSDVTVVKDGLFKYIKCTSCGSTNVEVIEND